MVWSVQTWLPVSVGMPEAGVALCYPCLGVQEWQPQFPLYSHPHVQVCCVLNGILKQILTSHAEKKQIICLYKLKAFFEEPWTFNTWWDEAF